MVRSSVASAAASPSTMRRPTMRMTASGSFHAGAPFPSLGSYDRGPNRRGLQSGARRQSNHQYHTFPTPPPKTPSERASGLIAPGHETPATDGSEDGSDASSTHYETPLPWKQLCLLALLSLAEQTALNSISPYLPVMVGSFDEIPAAQTGLYVGLLASAFALAQLTTNLIWGYLSDVVGRKPVMLLGTSLLAVCFVFFGFCRNYGQLIAVHVAMGLLNGNAAVVPTCLGEVTDRSNQSRAFTWLPVMYSIGGITGPALGGLLVGDVGRDPYPFMTPNLVGAVLLAASAVVLAFWFDETLESVDKKHFGLPTAWVEKLLKCGCSGGRKWGRHSSWSSRWPTGAGQNATTAEADESVADHDDDSAAVDDRQGLLHSDNGRSDRSTDEDAKPGTKQPSAWRELANRTTLTVLFTYLVFQLSNISFNSLYPIFASAPPPTGRELDPGIIGLSLSFAGLATIFFQVFLFQPLKSKMGNLGTYRAALLGLAVSMAMMPWIGYIDDGPWLGLGTGKTWLYAELGFILLLKNACAVGGLSSVMLLVSVSRSQLCPPCTCPTRSVRSERRVADTDLLTDYKLCTVT